MSREIKCNLVQLGLLAFISSLVGCKTTASSVVNVDQNRGQLSLYSSGDQRTTLTGVQKQEQATKIESTLKQELHDQRDDIPSLISLAEVEVSLKQLDAAEKNCHTILRKDQGNKEARKILAEIAMRRGNYDMASIFINSIGAAANKDSSILNMRAMIELHNSNNSAAMALFKQALKVNSDDLAVRMNLGVLLLKFRQLDQASIEFERILKSVPNHSDAKLHLAIIKSSRGQNEEALSMLNDTLKSDENNPLVLYNLAVVERNIGKLDDALDHLKLYVKNTHSKASDNDQVFALIGSIQRQQAAKGEKVSDEDLQSMVASESSDGDEAPKKVATAAEPKGAVKKRNAGPVQAAKAAPKATSKPVAAATQERPAEKELVIPENAQEPTSSDEIGDLEKALK